MAKVVAPLGSFSASGKIGKSLVFFSHLGRNVVRGLVTPANPQTVGQGDSRLLLGALGRAARAVVTPSDWFNDANTVTPSGQTWVSYMITNVINIYGKGTTGVSALQSAADASAATNLETAAEDVGLTDLTIAYATATDDTLTAGAQLYAIAAHTMNIKASNPDLYDRAPYDTALTSWSDSEVTAFVTDLQTVA